MMEVQSKQYFGFEIPPRFPLRVRMWMWLYLHESEFEGKYVWGNIFMKGVQKLILEAELGDDP